MRQPCDPNDSLFDQGWAKFSTYTRKCQSMGRDRLLMGLPDARSASVSPKY